MAFTARDGHTVELDDVESVTFRPLMRPALPGDRSHADERDQATRDLHDWSIFPFEVEVATSNGWHDLVGTEARAFVQAWMASLTPWLT